MARKYRLELTGLEIKAVRFAITALTDWEWLDQERQDNLPFAKAMMRALRKVEKEMDEE